MAKPFLQELELRTQIINQQSWLLKISVCLLLFKMEGEKYQLNLWYKIHYGIKCSHNNRSKMPMFINLSLPSPSQTSTLGINLVPHKTMNPKLWPLSRVFIHLYSPKGWWDSNSQHTKTQTTINRTNNKSHNRIKASTKPLVQQLWYWALPVQMKTKPRDRKNTFKRYKMRWKKRKRRREGTETRS